MLVTSSRPCEKYGVTALEPRVVSPAETDATALGMFGKYRLLRLLAAGGMAQVYLASMDGPGGFSKTCVVKRILPEHVASPAFNKMFVTEAKVAALLDHPNIVQTFDFGQFEGQYYLAMEWVAGGSVDNILRQAMRKGVTLGPRIAALIGIPVLEALAYLESATLGDQPLSLVHRDVTPGNVLVSNNGIVKLTDFGIVKSSASSELTVVGMLKGKYSYMSPEQANNLPLDHRSDIFSLGICLYEIATGRRLFKRDNLAATLECVTHATVPRPSRSDPAFPPMLERILMKALALHREDRYPSARDMREELERFSAGEHGMSGARELSTLMHELFTGGIATEVPAGVSSLQTSVPPQPRQAPSNTSTTAGFESGDDPVQSVEIELDDGSWTTLVLALVGMGALASLVFWLLVLR